MRMIPHHGSLEEFFEHLRHRGVENAGKTESDAQICARYEGDYAVLVLDSSGFTRITRDLGIIHFMALIVNMRDQVIPIFERNDALEIWFEPDNIFGIFPAASKAVKAALETQHTMTELNQGRLPENRLEVCIGVGAGRLLYIPPQHIFGQEMNFACKLGEDVAGPREILLTEATYQLIKDHVTGLETEPRSIQISKVLIHYHELKTTSQLTWLA